MSAYGDIEQIIAHASEITKKRPREALLAQAEAARLSKRLVTIRDDVPVSLDLESLRVREPDRARLRDLLVELEFHTLARQIDVPKEVAEVADSSAPRVVATEPLAARPQIALRYRTVSTAAEVADVVARATRASYIALEAETVADPAALNPNDPLTFGPRWPRDRGGSGRILLLPVAPSPPRAGAIHAGPGDAGYGSGSEEVARENRRNRSASRRERSRKGKAKS